MKDFDDTFVEKRDCCNGTVTEQDYPVWHFICDKCKLPCQTHFEVRKERLWRKNAKSTC